METKKSLIFAVFILTAFLLIGGGCNKETTDSTNSVEEDTGDTQEEEVIEDSKDEKNVEEIKVGPVENDLENLKKIQESVDNGSQPWRLDPYAVAVSDSIELGFNQEKDTFTLTSKTEMGEYSGTGEAEVEAVHNEVTYIIQLIQPVKQGEEGIWAINSVRKK